MLNLTKSFYMPNMCEYVGYDFQNRQTFESLEDILWELSYPAELYDDYFRLLNRLTDVFFANKQEIEYNQTFRFVKSDIIKNIVDENLRSGIFSSPLVFDEYFIPTDLLADKEYKKITHELLVEDMEGVADAYKYVYYLHLFYRKQLVNLKLNKQCPTPLLLVLDSFRSNFTDNSWDVDEFITKDLGMDNSTNLYNDVRLLNSFSVRGTAKNFIVTYNAIQKVFKSRFEEGRSNTRLEDLSNSYQPFFLLNSPKINFEELISKNRTGFTNPTNYNHSIKDGFSFIHPIFTSINYYFNDLPFLVSKQSDSSRYLWFD